MWSQVGLRKYRLQTKLVEVTEFQMNYFKSKRWCFQSQFSSVQSRSHVQLFATSWTTARQASITNSWSLLRLMSIESVMPFNHLILCHPFLLLPSIFPSIRIFSNELVLCIRWPNIGVSASALDLPMNIQDWFPLGWTGWISLQSKALSEFAPTPEFKSINFSVLSSLHSPTLSSIHDYRKNHSFDKMDLCRQSNVSAF